MNDEDYVFKIMVPRSAEIIEDGDITKIAGFFIVGEVPVSDMPKDEAAHDDDDEASVEVHDEAKVTFEYRGRKTAISLNNVDMFLQPPTDVHSEQNDAILCLAVSEALQRIADETWTDGSNVVPFRRR